ncbi:uncharacterized protein LOC129761305 [Toxorhynchites rutilus septentrionalis]|uniref:uncharacterized protein LOC129761305 n=1 Tax=Toxorhynchites rutilus septentrionalis TaxID=329112 RepID=UPI0024783F77|nr:uncharacterized protein LOC129761305 [Toxorhynchites rutilus septentrionalis]
MEEPVSFEEAAKSPQWCQAMDDEMKSHEECGSWNLVPLKPTRKAVGSKWVFRLKRNERGEVVKHKARIVAQGFSKRPGVDFEETFAPATCHATFRTFLAVAAKRRLIVQHFDVKTAYLNGTLEEEV